MQGIYIRYYISEEDTAMKQANAFAYVQRNNSLSKEELKRHAVRYIKSLKENADEHLMEQHNGEIEHFNQRYVTSLKLKEGVDVQLANLEEICLLLQLLNVLNLSHNFAENAAKLLHQIAPYTKELEHSTIQTTRVERRFYAELMEQIEVVYTQIIRQHNPSTTEMQHVEQLWATVCKQAIEKVEVRVERLSVLKSKHENNLMEFNERKQQNIEARERLNHARNELDVILDALES
ncbi:hypothetical protein [Lysinibacillus piscis]|uniref:Uncharacterized protein n=1 Tax=Lysinibacillus piscis TaxID=2518931 RepID=A0ABQ5NFD9_9BACI|nr:hypothetical protein [Lysinibacillus sp. KH24]GLC87105.1 hypothetical protein LYSBPC_02320 [Lysinibacillus sp. KH24]